MLDSWSMKKLLAIVVLGLLINGNAYALPKCKGDDRSKWTKCVGTHLTSEKAKITAEYGKNPGVVDGRYLWERNEKGTFFKGSKKNDKTVGHFFMRITYNSENDNRTEISGFVSKKGTQRGKSIDYFKNGDKIIFVGELSGLRPKKGTLFYIVDNERYYGDSLKLYPNGKGHLTYKDGSKYYGELKYFEKLKKSKRHGKGTLTYPNGKIEKGIWKEDDLIN